LVADLFQFRGPLGDFNSKILISEAFGIITGPLAHELHSMRAIRNAFAHAKTLISFVDEPVKREVDALKILVAIRNSDSRVKLELTSKNWFLLEVRITLIMLEQIAAMKGTADQVFEKALCDAK
jgi:DNA-binding MltR family transcriptional regulator